MPLYPFNPAGQMPEVSDLPLSVRLVKDGGATENSIVGLRPVQGGFLVRLAGIEAREDAATLVGCEVQFPRSTYAPLDQAEFYIEDMVGCEVLGLDGERLGHVGSTFWNGAQDVMTIVADDGGETLVPVIAEFIRSFEAEARRLIVDLHA
jgi:16S rRNA processing protein RimM